MSGIKYEVLAGDDLISALRGGRTGDLLDYAAYAAADEIERLQRVLQKVMARCADLLDEDQFNELDAMVTSQPSRAIIQQAKECGCGICDACVAAPAQKTLTDLAREMNYQPSRYEAHLEARLAEAVECCTIKDNRNLRLEAKVADLERQLHWALTGDMPTDSASGGAK